MLAMLIAQSGGRSVGGGRCLGHVYTHLWPAELRGILIVSWELCFPFWPGLSEAS